MSAAVALAEQAIVIPRKFPRDRPGL